MWAKNDARLINEGFAVSDPEVDTALVAAALTFDTDNFRQRRASQAGAGVAYDPESLITGAEIAQGLDYGDRRQWPNEETKQRAYRGEISIDEILIIAPRVASSDWHSEAQSIIDEGV